MRLLTTLLLLSACDGEIRLGEPLAHTSGSSLSAASVTEFHGLLPSILNAMDEVCGTGAGPLVVEGGTNLDLWEHCPEINRQNQEDILAEIPTRDRSWHLVAALAARELVELPPTPIPRTLQRHRGTTRMQVVEGSWWRPDVVCRIDTTLDLRLESMLLLDVEAGWTYRDTMLGELEWAESALRLSMLLGESPSAVTGSGSVRLFGCEAQLFGDRWSVIPSAVGLPDTESVEFSVALSDLQLHMDFWPTLARTGATEVGVDLDVDATLGGFSVQDDLPFFVPSVNTLLSMAGRVGVDVSTAVEEAIAEGMRDAMQGDLVDTISQIYSTSAPSGHAYCAIAGTHPTSRSGGPAFWTVDPQHRSCPR